MKGRDFIACAERLSRSSEEADLRTQSAEVITELFTKFEQYFGNWASCFRKLSKYT